MNKRESFLHFKDIFKLVMTILSWTAFSLLILIGIALLYYVITASLYSSRGEEFKPPFSLYTIISPSMEPKVKVYDVILDIKVNEEDIQKGDIITFISSSPISMGMTVTHRVVDVIEQDGEIFYRTKGDNNTTPDTGLTPFSSVKGKTFLKIPQLGRIQFLVASKGGWLFVVLVPALGILLYDVLKLFKLVGVKNKVAKVSNSKAEVIDEKQKTLQQIRKQKYKEKFADKLAENDAFELPKLADLVKEDKENITLDDKSEDLENLTNDFKDTRKIEITESNEDTIEIPIKEAEEFETKDVVGEHTEVDCVTETIDESDIEETKFDRKSLIEDKIEESIITLEEVIEKADGLDIETESNEIEQEEIDESLAKIAKIISEVQNKNKEELLKKEEITKPQNNYNKNVQSNQNNPNNQNSRKRRRRKRR